jgi:hypothetical protein
MLVDPHAAGFVFAFSLHPEDIQKEVESVKVSEDPDKVFLVFWRSPA